MIAPITSSGGRDGAVAHRDRHLSIASVLAFDLARQLDVLTARQVLEVQGRIHRHRTEAAGLTSAVVAFDELSAV